MAVYKDKNGTWYVSARYDNWQGEHARKVKRGFKTKKEAMEWERDFLLEKAGSLDMTFEAFKKYKDKTVFVEELRRSLFYYFCSKCEWEVIIAPWCGGKGTEDIKVDVYWQVMNNWEIFLDYVWNSKRKK